mmetsp:Transcript_29759/g.57188  ORF Transcript_29759/g.57188 Transcript_29759/m.57188 type:complete len:637 (-) Transcript_29759:101-2011(-)
MLAGLDALFLVDLYRFRPVLGWLGFARVVAIPGNVSISAVSSAFTINGPHHVLRFLANLGVWSQARRSKAIVEVMQEFFIQKTWPVLALHFMHVSHDCLRAAFQSTRAREVLDRVSKQSTDHRVCALRRHLFVVSSLERHQHLAPRQRQQPLSHVGVPQSGHLHASERVSKGGVEPGGDDHQVRSKRASDGQDQLLEAGEVVVVAAPLLGPRHVDAVALRAVHAHLIRVARARVEVLPEAVQGHEQHPLVILQDVLGAVAMVHIPVQHQHARRGARAQHLLGRHRHVVVEAEAHGLRVGGVVPGRADEAEGVGDAPGAHRLGRRDSAPRSQARRGGCAFAVVDVPEAAGLGPRVALEPQVHALHVLARVHRLQLRVLGQAGFDARAAVEQSSDLGHLVHRNQAPGLLRVFGIGALVVQHAVVVAEARARLLRIHRLRAQGVLRTLLELLLHHLLGGARGVLVQDGVVPGAIGLALTLLRTLELLLPALPHHPGPSNPSVRVQLPARRALAQRQRGGARQGRWGRVELELRPWGGRRASRDESGGREGAGPRVGPPRESPGPVQGLGRRRRGGRLAGGLQSLLLGLPGLLHLKVVVVGPKLVLPASRALLLRRRARTRPPQPRLLRLYGMLLLHHGG